jgi:hypothetical protein
MSHFSTDKPFPRLLIPDSDYSHACMYVCITNTINKTYLQSLETSHHITSHHVTSHHVSSLLHLASHGVTRYVLDGIRNGEDVVGLGVGDLDGELFLELQRDLHSVQRVQVQVFLEASISRDLVGIHLVGREQ